MAKREPDAGEYDKYVELQEATETNTRGEVTQTWAKIAELWCSLRPIRGDEYFSSAQVQAQVLYVARTWWRDDISPAAKMRLYVSDEARTFEIRSVVDVEERHVEWEFRLTEAV